MTPDNKYVKLPSIDDLQMTFEYLYNDCIDNYRSRIDDLEMEVDSLPDMTMDEIWQDGDYCVNGIGRAKRNAMLAVSNCSHIVDELIEKLRPLVNTTLTLEERRKNINQLRIDQCHNIISLYKSLDYYCSMAGLKIIEHDCSKDRYK